MRNIAVVAHKYLPQPDDNLIDFLNIKKESRVLHIKHSFPDASDRCSSYSLYSKGSKIKEKTSADYKFLPEALVYIKELFFTIKWIVFSKTRWDLYIGMDGLCVFFGLILRSIGACKKVIFWSIDFVPQGRFKQSWKNLVYRNIDILACKKADEVWDLSPKMAKGRKKFLGLDNKDYKFRKIVPYGVWTNRIKKYPYESCEENTLVFMGHLIPKQGVDVVIGKIPEIVKRIPNFKFKIIGGGSYREKLINLARNLSVDKYCIFLGRIEDNRILEDEIARSALAIAPYLKTPNSYTYYADSGKIKTYLACGVPVLLTDLPWNVGEIQKNKCGLIIKDDGSDLAGKVLFIMKPKINREFRENAVKYSKNFDYEKIFSRLEL